MQAGIESLDVFGALNTVDALADGDIMKWESICQMRYEKVYVKLLLNKAKAEYQEKYTDIMKSKR
ncbi:hypothetical protein DJ568_15470 [Mucilaginibacter hurinus]|uniref:Uncharacterized protein n=1 Tax=Mucilaginibacter hurinus TaxID=2201324 RepID=A0A367GKD4_9SPHI|nr:hypothetical protein [Mucilaginibacter hurinus]RCH53937.1 hypothetical protein DJ568_15470 [Mucilaginibacter hurinus]